MAVYVDDALIPASVPNGNRVLMSQWSHLMADTLDELVTFGRQIGMRQAWLQVKRSGVHFDLTVNKRRQAIRAGAVELPTRTDEWRRVVAAAREQYPEACERYRIEPTPLGVLS